jgi:uncharacterized membrane protein
LADDDLRGVIGLAARYVKQETLDPVKQLAKLLIYGIVATLATAAGVILLVLGILRLLQTETGTTFTGHLVWLPYLITVVVLGVVIAFALARIGKRRGR